jgi:hypothetical protein
MRSQQFGIFHVEIYQRTQICELVRANEIKVLLLLTGEEHFLCLITVMLL